MAVLELRQFIHRGERTDLNGNPVALRQPERCHDGPTRRTNSRLRTWSARQSPASVGNLGHAAVPLVGRETDIPMYHGSR
jgi:hypothetical protein